MFCPHCESIIPAPPEAWRFLPPWQCSFCAGLYGISLDNAGFKVPSDMKPLWPLFTWWEAMSFGFYADKRYYVYAICYPSGLPFYIGHGKGRRVCDHHEEIYKNPPKTWSEKHELMIHLADRNESEWYHFLALVDTKPEAAAIEQKYIQTWGLRRSGGLLVNRTLPKAYPHIGDLPESPREFKPKSITPPGQPRKVVHPLILIGATGWQSFQFDCQTCKQRLSCPDELMKTPVQCPSCGHFMMPIYSHWHYQRSKNFKSSGADHSDHTHAQDSE